MVSYNIAIFFPRVHLGDRSYCHGTQYDHVAVTISCTEQQCPKL